MEIEPAKRNKYEMYHIIAVSRAPITRHVVSTLPPSPAGKPGNPSPRSYHGLGRRRREDIRAIRCGGSNCCGPKSTRRKTIELNRSCFTGPALSKVGISTGSGTVTPEACTVSLRDSGRATPAPFPLRQPCAFFIFSVFLRKFCTLANSTI